MLWVNNSSTSVVHYCMAYSKTKRTTKKVRKKLDAKTINGEKPQSDYFSKSKRKKIVRMIKRLHQSTEDCFQWKYAANYNDNTIHCLLCLYECGLG